MESISISFNMFCVFALLFAKSNGFTLDLIHPNSPLNPFRNPTKSQFDYIQEAFRHSQSRAAYIKNRINGDSAKFKIDMKPTSVGYIMKYSIGTPPFETYGIADTGSDITWTQCKPCTVCFNQSLPMFDPKKSRSYKTVSCDSASCNSRNFGCGESDICQYEVTYGDQSFTVGDVAIDTFTLGNTSFKNVLFGCGHQNGGTFTSDTSGIVGLGGDGATSIIFQLNKQIGGKFSYCLSPDPNARSHISFGRDAVVKGAKAVSTPLIKKPEQATFYWLSLESITVGNRNLKVKQQSSPTNIGGRQAIGIKQATVDGNIIIDSGTTLTLLPSDLYTSFESAVQEAISATPVSDPTGTFPLCYASSENFEVPSIVAHFTGADVELSPKGTFVEMEEGLVCSTIISDTSIGISIFGYLSEIDYIVAYDLVAETVTFQPADCSKF